MLGVGIGTLITQIQHSRATQTIVQQSDVRELALLLETEFPNAKLKVRQLGQDVVLSGLVERPQVVSRIVNMAEDYAPSVINNIMCSPGNNE